MSGEVRGATARRWWSIRPADFKLTCTNLNDISCCQDGMPFFIYIFYRFLVAGYFLGFLIYFMVFSFRGLFGAKFFIFLTDWTYIVVNAYLSVAFINVFMDYILGYKRGERSHLNRRGHRFRYQLQWLLFNMSITVSIIVTLVYWPILRPMIPATDKPPLYLNLSVHLFPTVFCLLDLFVTKVIVKFVHVLYPALYLTFYGLFAIFYWVADGTDPFGHPYIYPIIDFENHPGVAAASMIGVVVAVFLSHAFVKLLYYLRVRYVDLRGPSSIYDETTPLNPDGQLSGSGVYDEII